MFQKDTFSSKQNASSFPWLLSIQSNHANSSAVSLSSSFLYMHHSKGSQTAFALYCGVQHSKPPNQPNKSNQLNKTHKTKPKSSMETLSMPECTFLGKEFWQQVVAYRVHCSTFSEALNKHYPLATPTLWAEFAQANYLRPCLTCSRLLKQLLF